MPVVAPLIPFQSFLAAWVASPSDLIHDAFNPDNPFFTWAQVEDMSTYYAWLGLASGAVAGIILIPVMLITALPTLPAEKQLQHLLLHPHLLRRGCAVVHLHTCKHELLFHPSGLTALGL